MKTQEFNSTIIEDTELPDVITARGLVSNALQNPTARQEYFDYMVHLRNKHGKEYSTRVHQKATALATPVSKKGTETIAETIKKVDQKFELVSRSGKNLGKYPTNAAAKKREQQVNYYKHKDKIDEASNPVDTITVDVPLFIRLLEYAREDAKTDMDLHNVTEKTIALSSTGRTLSMADYNKICGSKK